MSDVYSVWKPLRNFLRKVDLNDALSVIRYYSVRKSLDEKPSVPSDIQLHPWADRNTAFLAWELETLAREALYSCDYNMSPEYTLKSISGISSAINKLKAIDEYISQEYINEKNIQHEVSVRLAHRQFKYQTERPNWHSIIRYGEIYSYPELSKLVEASLGISSKKIYTIGIGAWGQFINQYGIRYPLETLELNGINSADYDRFIALFACELHEMKNKLGNERHYDDEFFYAYHSLYEYPIILLTLDSLPTHICPIPTLLYWKITSGLYYKLYMLKGFDNAFGNAYEDYVGRMLKKTISGSNAELFAGEKNSGTSPHRIDWIIDKHDEALFIECKVKRLSLGAKVSLNDNEMFTQLGVLGDAVVQAYQSYVAYRDKLYTKPSYTLDDGKKSFVTVVTLERWYLMGQQIEMLDAIVREKMAAIELPGAMIDEVPYVIMSINDLEEVAFLAKTTSIRNIIDPYINEYKKAVGGEFALYVHHQFKDKMQDYHYVFAKKHVELFTIPSIR